MKLRLLRVGAFACVLAISPRAASVAASLAVYPVRVELPSDGRPEVIHLRSNANGPTLVRVEAVGWADPDQLDNAPPAPEILAVPPVFELDGGSEQIIRLALRHPAELANEVAYRLLITEVPRGRELGANGLAFAVRLNLPMFVTPKGATADPVWSLRGAQEGTTELVLTNQGSAHLRVHDLKLLATAQNGAVFGSPGVEYVLAGEEKTWPLEQPLSALPDVLEVRVETNRGPLVAQVAREGR